MFSNINYHINDTDHFLPDSFALLVEELVESRKQLASFSESYKLDILISFFKNHSIKSAWQQENPLVVGMLVSGDLSMKHTEAIFNDSQHNRIFQQEFELYIHSVFD